MSEHRRLRSVGAYLVIALFLLTTALMLYGAFFVYRSPDPRHVKCLEQAGIGMVLASFYWWAAFPSKPRRRARRHRSLAEWIAD